MHCHCIRAGVTRYLKKSCQEASLHKFAFVPKHSPTSETDVAQLSEFINTHKRIFLLTGAGISTESGIRDYRSEGVGLYSTSTDRPIQYNEFLRNPTKRHRYWARNFAAWPIFSKFEPNVNHKVMADMEKNGILHWLVTQNVDSLHKKAGSMKITELHGTTARVGCLSCDYDTCRHTIQSLLVEANQNWSSTAMGRQGPDGDILINEKDVERFNMIDCPNCGGILKPKVIFFGDNVSREVKDFLMEKLKESDSLLVVGSSLQVYSSFRFIIAANELKIPIAILNIGETRGDRFADLKISAKAGDILPKLKLHWKNGR